MLNVEEGDEEDGGGGGHLLVHHTSAYDSYKKYTCKTEHRLTGIRRRSRADARLTLTGEVLLPYFSKEKKGMR